MDEPVVAYFKVGLLSPNLHGETEKNHDKPSVPIAGLRVKI
jgi:hypothetical protein